MVQEDSVSASAAQFKPKSRLPLIVTGIAAFVAGSLLGALVTAATVSGTEEKGGKGKRKGKTPTETPVASASASAAVPGDGGAAAARKSSVAARAAAGDAKAAAEIDKKPKDQRTLEEAVALARSRNEAKKKELVEIGRKIKLVPKLVKEDKELGERYKELTNDREIAIDAMHTLAALPGPVGPDLLYNIIASSYKENEMTKLADEFLYSKEVRANASFALGALLDLRKAEKCEDALKAVEKVKQNGDRRAFNPLMRMHQKRGCGEKNLDDCWPCLREGDLLKDATVAAQKRAAP
jgi:hypothetical protein